MKTIVMGKKIKRSYELVSDLNEDNKFTSKPYIKELEPEIKWEEICSYEGEAQTSYMFIGRCINISEDEEVVVIKEIFRADLGSYIQYTDKVLEDDDSGRAAFEEDLKSLLKIYNKQMIENNPKAKDYCDLHKLNYEDTDYDQVMKYISRDLKDMISITVTPEDWENARKAMRLHNSADLLWTYPVVNE
jgi:hypothetical protein